MMVVGLFTLAKWFTENDGYCNTVINLFTKLLEFMTQLNLFTHIWQHVEYSQ